MAPSTAHMVTPPQAEEEEQTPKRHSQKYSYELCSVKKQNTKLSSRLGTVGQRRGGGYRGARAGLM